MSARWGNAAPRAAPLAASVLLASAMGCGARTAIDTPDGPTFDGGPSDTGVDAGVDAFVETDAGPPPADVCIELPPLAPPEMIEVSFVSRIESAELYFLVDVTGSMEEEIMQIRARLRDTIVPGIVAQIPDVRFSVARFADYPVNPYGDDGRRGRPADDLYRLEQRSTRDIDAVQDAIGRLDLEGGNDLPEAAVEALYISATGMVPPRLVPPRACPAGTVGYPCFEREGSRIVVLISDAAMHNGPSSYAPYALDLGHPSHDYGEAIEALRGIGAKVLALYSGQASDPGLGHLERVARDTGAVRPDGSPIVFNIGASGSSLGTDVVEAVRTLVEEVLIDVDVSAEDWPFDAVDASEFVTGVATIAAEPPNGATQLPDRFDDVRPGTEVRFSIQLANERFPRTSEPQVYRLTVVLRGDGVTRLRETVVDVVVPSIDGRGCDDVLVVD